MDQSNTDKLREEDEGEGRHLMFELNQLGRGKRELNLYRHIQKHSMCSCVGRMKWVQRLKPKSLTGGQSRLWHSVKVNAGIGLHMVNVLESTPVSQHYL